MNIYLDLDGPILDVSQRYYLVHSSIMKKIKINDSVTKDGYWRLKRARRSPIKHNELINQQLLKRYSNLWLQLIEQKKYLRYDKIWHYAKDALKQLSKGNTLTLITVRQKEKNLLWELKRFNLLKHFDTILISKAINTISAKTKLIINSKGFKAYDSIIVGDTEMDIAAGKECRIKTAAVLCGIRNKRLIKVLRPDIVVNDISAFARLIQKWRAIP